MFRSREGTTSVLDILPKVAKLDGLNTPFKFPGVQYKTVRFECVSKYQVNCVLSICSNSCYNKRY